MQLQKYLLKKGRTEGIFFGNHSFVKRGENTGLYIGKDIIGVRKSECSNTKCFIKRCGHEDLNCLVKDFSLYSNNLYLGSENIWTNNLPEIISKKIPEFEYLRDLIKSSELVHAFPSSQFSNGAPAQILTFSLAKPPEFLYELAERMPVVVSA